MVPLVAQSFTPSRMYESPSSVAVVARRAGSDPTSGSVKRKAEISPAATRGRYSSFWAVVPNILTGWGTPMDWCAESVAATAGLADPISVSALLK